MCLLLGVAGQRLALAGTFPPFRKKLWGSLPLLQGLAGALDSAAWFHTKFNPHSGLRGLFQGS